jgi:predicted CXXCH cytochrome family protein
MRSLPLAGLIAAVGSILVAAAVQAGHPVGDLDRPSRGIERVGCMDCHTPHGSDDEVSLQSDGDGVACRECHDNKVGSARALNEHPRGVMVLDFTSIRRVFEAGGRLNSSGQLVCLTCHQVHADSDPMALCTTCHRGQDKRMEDGDRGHGGGECQQCHAVHRGTASETSRRIASPGDATGCLTCHADGAKHAPERMRPGKLGHPSRDLEGGVAQTNPPLRGCTSCHPRAHDPRALDHGSCEKCHDEQSDDRARGGHGEATCLDCHPAHLDPPLLLASTAELNPLSRRCLSCHSPEVSSGLATQKVAEFDHPEMIFRPDGQRWTPLGNLPLHGPGGEVVPAGENGDLTCSSCHTTHGPEAGRAGRGLKRSGWEEPCAACHGQDALPFYLYFHEPARRGGDPKSGL